MINDVVIGVIQSTQTEQTFWKTNLQNVFWEAFGVLISIKKKLLRPVACFDIVILN